MISYISSIHFVGVFLIASAFICGIVGSSNEAKALVHQTKNHTHTGAKLNEEVSSLSSSEDFCHLLRVVKTSFATDFLYSQLGLPNSYIQCNVDNPCSSVSCRALLGETKIKAGVSFKLCQPLKAVEFWTDVPKVWKNKWTHTFPASGNAQRIEVFPDKHLVNSQNFTYSSQENRQWFVKVLFDIEKKDEENYVLSLLSSIQKCETELEKSCQNITLLNLPNHHLHFNCDVSSSLQQLQYLTGEHLSIKSRPRRSSSRSSHSVFNEGIHSKKDGTSQKIGESCDIQNIFVCGNGASCVNVKDGLNICKCLANFVLNSNGSCIESRKVDPTAPPSQPVNNTSSTSTALGAILSVFILMALAAAVFFGTKYHVFSRIRNRLPLSYRCWPWPYFRRSSPLEDNVSMVNPIDPDDDDDPLLL